MYKINNKFISNIYKQVGKETGQNEINRHSAVWTQSENRENRVFSWFIEKKMPFIKQTDKIQFNRYTV